MNPYVNRCSFPFDENFKAMIKQERVRPEVQALKECKTKEDFEKVQEKLRIYLKQTHPLFFKIRYSDMFAFAIALIYPHLDECATWKEVKFQCPNENDPLFKWTYDSEQIKSTCVCGHSINVNHSYIIYHKDSPLRLVVGCCCIEKNEIVHDFPLVKKQRKEYLKKKHIKKWTDYNNQLLRLHRTRTHTSCQYCKKRVQSPYQVCFGCRQTNYDKCSCGKSKKKEYPTCYTCS